MCMQAAHLLGQMFESIMDELMQFVASQRAVVVPAAMADAASPDAPQRTHAAKIERLLASSVVALVAELGVVERPALKPLVNAFLRMRTPWLDSTRIKMHMIVRDTQFPSEAEALAFVWKTLSLSHNLQLGVASLSTNTGGAKRLFFFKRPAPNDAAYLASMTRLIAAFGCPLVELAWSPLAQLSNVRPASAALAVLPDWTDAVVEAHVQEIGAL